MCLPAVSKEPKPAILAYQLSDLFSLVICGYIGGRCVQLKYPTPRDGFWSYSLAAAFVTAFGGGSCYSLLMSRPGCRRFGWQDPFALLAAFLGSILATQAVTSCEESFGSCSETFRFFDCVNNAILIAWGCSKSFVDFDTSSSIWSRLTRSFATTYTYSFGGGVIRDVLARCVYGEAAGSVGNLSPSIVLPAILATAFYNYLLMHRSSALFQLGLGLPVLACLFHYGDAFARCTIGTW